MSWFKSVVLHLKRLEWWMAACVLVKETRATKSLKSLQFLWIIFNFQFSIKVNNLNDILNMHIKKNKFQEIDIFNISLSC